MSDRDPRLSVPAIHVMLAISAGARHGYAIMQAVAEQTGGRVRIWPASLYGIIGRLSRDDLIVETDDALDPRRRVYDLTPAGRAALIAEVESLGQMIDWAAAAGLRRGDAR